MINLVLPTLMIKIWFISYVSPDSRRSSGVTTIHLIYQACFFPGTWPKWPQHLSPWSELVSLGSCEDASVILVDGHQSLQIRFICGPLCKPDISTQTSVEFEPWCGITGLWAYIQLDVCTRPFNLELKVCSGRVCSCSASSPPLLLCGPQ